MKILILNTSELTGGAAMSEFLMMLKIIHMVYKGK